LNDYGVWGEKSMFGNKYMGVVRTTFLIDEKGKIAHIITKVKSSDHSNQILKLWKNSL
jgi:thioredoxin-dependent peroxiredoxin